MFQKFKNRLSLASIFFFFTAELIANAPILRLDSEAQLFMAAQDYEKASQIYSYLLTQSLPDWQQSLVLYNLGTTKLAQKENQQALEFYRLIPFATVVNPHLFRAITFNTALAYLHKAQQLDQALSHFELKEQLDDYERSLEKFDETQKLDCLLQKFEESQPNLCHSSEEIEREIKSIKLAGEQNKNKQRQNLIDQNNFYANSFILIQSLNRLNAFLGSLDLSKVPPSLQSSYQHYFLNRAESLLPLWEKLQTLNQEFKQKEIIDSATAYFHKFLIELQKNEKTAKAALKSVIQQLEQLETQSNAARIAILLIEYQLLFLQDEWSIVSLQELQKAQQELFTDNKELLNQANEYLAKSLAYTSDQQKNARQFFLLAAFEELKQLQSNPLELPKDALEQALMQAWQAKRILQIFTKLPPEMQLSTSIPQKIQESVIEAGKQFFITTLSFQKKVFEQKDSTFQRCQDKPWDQVLPLFSLGNKAALAALNLIENSRAAILQQEKTIENWKKALKILSDSTQAAPSPGATSEEKKLDEFNDLFRSIQEMQAQDEPQEKSTEQEWHTW